MALRVHVEGGATLQGGAILRLLPAWSAGLREELVAADGLGPSESDFVILAGGPSGGIGANQRRPADFCEENLLAAIHGFQLARRHGARRALYLASSCCYPRDCPQPMTPESLWSGPVEPTNGAYAAAKLAGMELAAAYRAQHGLETVSVIPANCYGPGDDFGAATSHVIPALIARFHEAKVFDRRLVTLWGSGKAVREFLHADDLAGACLQLLEARRPPPVVNVGGGEAISIGELAELVRAAVGYTGRIAFDATRPDGAPRKTLDSGPLRALGWRPAVGLADGIAETYAWFLKRAPREETVDAI
jgi:GDP-L-fucose synthase